MKFRFIVSLTILPLCGVHAQGTVQFANFQAGAQLNAPVFESDGITEVSGTGFLAELLAGPSAGNLVSVATTGFLTGAGAGYFAGGTQYLSSVLPGDPAWIQVRVWNTASGSSFLNAKASGLPDSWWASSVFSVTTGNVPSGVGPTPPSVLTGLGTSPVYLNSVPEPSPLGLIGLGILAALFGYKTRHREQM